MAENIEISLFEQIAVGFGIPFAYFCLGVAALSAVVFPIIQMIQNWKKAITALIGVGAVAVLFLICFLLADKQEFTIGDKYASAAQMQLVEGSIFTFYALLLIAVIAILYSSVSSYFK